MQTESKNTADDEFPFHSIDIMVYCQKLGGL